jgi:hypothetical protein
MKYICTYILLFLSIYNNAQNLVPNPSFESYTSCPTNFGQINYANGWNYIITSQTADYYNRCATNTNVAIPKNFYGTNYQQPRTGNGYAGVTTLSPSNNLRGNICTQLTNTLISNNYYLVKFYTSNVQSYFIASNNLALNFSNTLTYTLAPNTTLNLPMHIYKFGNPVITDTLNWTEIMGIYKANGNEQYVTIGNFKDSANTKIDTTNYGWPNFYATYYMIDDVSVEPICTPFWSYRDTAVAIGDSVLIGPAITGLNINWYTATGTFITNAPGIYVKPNSPTFYTATEDFCGSTVSHTIHVGASPLGLVSSSEVENNLKISPNPTDGVLRISTSLDVTDLSIKITDVLGKEALVSDYKEQIDISFLENGIYFLSMYKNNQLLITKKVVKQ